VRVVRILSTVAVRKIVLRTAGIESQGRMPSSSYFTLRDSIKS